MNYKPKKYDHLFSMQGFSRKLLENHFKLYEGYVENANNIVQILSKEPPNPKDPQYAELKRRFGWEYNGVRLHEYYFDNLGGNGQLKRSNLYTALEKQFGNYANWETDFKATGGMRGIGWAILYRDDFTGFLFNQWINEHDGGHFAGCSPILVLDVFEHAFMIDYGVKKDEYINAFLKNTDWEIASLRFEGAIKSVPFEAEPQPAS